MAGATVLVTGGGSGLGRQIALRSARRGARVVLWDRDEAAARSVRDDIRAHGRQADHEVVDVTDEAAVAAAADRAGPVDVLVNNAGVVTGRRLLDSVHRQAEVISGLAIITAHLIKPTKILIPHGFF